MLFFLLFYIENVYDDRVLQIIVFFFKLSMNKALNKLDRTFIHKQWDKQLFSLGVGKGSITMMPKPPGGKNLTQFIEFLHGKDINVLVSLLQFDEINAFQLLQEGSISKEHGIDFINFQIKDHDVPNFFIPFNQLIELLANEIAQGKNVAIHCYAGIGRTGLTAASVLIKLGTQVDLALIKLSQTRGIKVPETLPQISWLHRFAEDLSAYQEDG
jgi:protein-tyrosine phosphatase